MSHPIEATRYESETTLGNAVIGGGSYIEPDVTVGYRYHKDCGPARVGKHSILRKGTLVYGDVETGDYFQTGHYAVIRAKVRMGDYCTIFNQCTLEGLIWMGDGVRIMAHVYIPSRTWFGNNVFVGPGVTILNDRLATRYDDPPPVRGPRIEDDVAIGGGVTIMAGVTIGWGSFIAAGAMVVKDVPPHSLVIGVPGRIQPLPPDLDRPNSRAVTTQPLDIWHPDTPDLSAATWPKEWGIETG